MDRHWTLDLVALAGVLAGFALLTVGQATLLAGVLAAGSAYALLLPELVDAPAGPTGPGEYATR